MLLPNKLKLLSVLSTAILLSACGGGGGGVNSSPVQSNYGSLKVSLTDAPACGFDAVNVTVNKVRVNQSSTANDADAGWVDIALAAPQKINLTSLTNGVLTSLGQASLPAGHYNQIRLVLTPTSANGLENSVVPTGAKEVPLTTPSAVQSGIKVNGNFDVATGNLADVVLDFDACRSVFRTGNNTYMLKPVVTATAVVTSGSISGTVDSSLLTNHPVVAAEVNGKVVHSTIPDSTGNFQIGPLAQNNYTVVITADAHATEVINNVPVTPQKDTFLNNNGAAIKLADSATHKAYGVVSTPTPNSVAATVTASQAVTPNQTVEVGFINTDNTGNYSLTLPVAAINVVDYSNLASSSPSVNSAGTFSLLPTATGLTGTSATVNVTTQDVKQDFVLQ
jgi:hypothetical protein